MPTLHDESYEVEVEDRRVPVFRDMCHAWMHNDPPPGVPAWRHFSMAISRWRDGPRDYAIIWWYRPKWLNEAEYKDIMAIERLFCDWRPPFRDEIDAKHPAPQGRLPRIFNENLQPCVTAVAAVITPRSFEEPEFDFERSPLSEHMNMVVERGYDPADPGRYRSRSEAMFAGACAMVRGRVPDEVILAALGDRDLGISEHVRAQPYPAGYAARQLHRAKETVHG